MRRRCAAILPTLVALVGSAAMGVAQVPKQTFEAGNGNLRLGPVRVHPFLSVGEMFDSNVFLQPTDTQSDFITVISPGFILNLPLGRHQVSVGYRGGLSWYLQDEVQRTNERPNTQFDPLIERWQNDGATGTEYKFADRWAASLNYLNILYAYENQPPLPDGTLQNYGSELNRVEQYASVDLYYLVAPKTSLLAEYTYIPINYANDTTAETRNNYSNVGRVGVRGRITSKITALAKVGYQAKVFNNPGQDGYDGPVANLSVVYQPTDWTQLTLLFDRETQEASFLQQGDDFYVWTGGSLLLEHVFTPKLRAFVLGAIGNADYGRSQRNDDLYEGSVGIRYQIQDYLAVSGQYLYEQRVSANTPGYDFDYTDNRVFVRVLLGL
jgi:hypothetical protein